MSDVRGRRPTQKREKVDFDGGRANQAHLAGREGGAAESQRGDMAARAKRQRAIGARERSAHQDRARGHIWRDRTGEGRRAKRAIESTPETVGRSRRHTAGEKLTAYSSHLYMLSVYFSHLYMPYLTNLDRTLSPPQAGPLLVQSVLGARTSIKTRLKNMSVPSHVSEEALAHLARMPSLEFLRIDFYGAGYRALLNTPGTNFSRPTVLELNTALINDDTAALTSFPAAFARNSPVKELNLDSTTNPHDTSLPDFFFAVSEFTALQQCHLAVSSRTLQWNGAPVSAEILEPLYRVKGMSVLDLSSLPMSVSPDTVRKMAAAWPTVRGIHLGQ